MSEPELIHPLAERIVTAIEGRFREWLMSGEHAEAKALVAEILTQDLRGWSYDYRLKSEAAYLRHENTLLQKQINDLWPHAQKMHTLAHLTEAHTGLADNSAEGIIAAMVAMRATIKSLNRRAQYAESKCANCKK